MPLTPPADYVYVRQAPALTEAGALALAEAAIQAGKRDRVTIAVAVVDNGGHLIVFRRMDDVPFVSVDVAIGKARTAAAIASPSAKFEHMINNGAPSMLSAPGLVPLGGGLPVLDAGRMVGAIGVSGGHGEEDSVVAQAALDAFQPHPSHPDAETQR